MSQTPVRIGIVTVSDRASRGVYQDLGGPAIRDCLTEILSCSWEAVPRLIPDERPLIEQTLKELCDQRRQWDRQARMHFWLHAWLTVHVPLSVSLVILTVTHAWIALKGHH